VFYAGLVGSWGGQVPGVIFFLHFYSHSLSSVYLGAAAGYALMCALLCAIILTLDWEVAVEEARLRSEKKIAAESEGDGEVCEEK
jgi:hypothetical protein